MEVWFNLLGWFLSFITATGNGLVIFLVVKTHRLHNSSNWLVMSLAIADFCVGLIVFPLGFLCHSNNSISCNLRVYIFFHWFFLHASVANLCTLTWDRYIAIIYPFKYDSSIFERRPVVVIISAWLTSFLVALSLLVGMYVTTSATALKVLRITGVSGFDVICSILLVFAVIRILAVARNLSRRDHAVNQQVQWRKKSSTAEQQIICKNTQIRRRKNNTGSFIAVIIMFFLCCYGAATYLIIRQALFHDISNNAAKAVTLLVVFSSTVNPLVYAFLKNDIKKEMLRFVCRKDKNQRINSGRSERTQLSCKQEQVEIPAENI